MLDVDGTLIPYDYDALPSKKVIEAIKKAQKKRVKTFLVTGRAFESTQHILNRLQLTNGIVVTNSGACIFDIKTTKPLYLRPIEKNDAKKIVKLLRNENIQFYLKKDMYDGSSNGSFKNNDTFKEAFMIFTNENYTHEKIVGIFNKLTNFPNLTLHKSKHKDPKKYGFTITHAEATKAHGIELIIKKYKLAREEIIGVGDGYNDFPLLAASGLKVAMGNALPSLKDYADVVAPSVENDGVAWVIDKFVLHKV